MICMDADLMIDFGETLRPPLRATTVGLRGGVSRRTELSAEEACVGLDVLVTDKQQKYRYLKISILPRSYNVCIAE